MMFMVILCPSPTGNYTGAQNDWKGAWWHSSLSEYAGYLLDSLFLVLDSSAEVLSFSKTCTN